MQPILFTKQRATIPFHWLDLQSSPLLSEFVVTAPPTSNKGPLLPLSNGERAPYINLDNAASTTPLPAVWEAVQRFLPYYSSVHRGSGFKSRLSTAAYEEAHEIIGHFVGYEGRYQVDPKTGDYAPEGYTDHFGDYFSLSEHS